MKSLKNVYRNLFEYRSETSIETSMKPNTETSSDAKVSLTLPGVGTFEITPLQSILIAYTMELFINEVTYKEAIGIVVEESNEGVVKDSENLLAASKQYFRSFSLLESSDTSRWSAPALSTLVNKEGEVLPTLINRVETSFEGVSYASGYGYFIEALIDCYIYKEYTRGKEGFKTSGKIKEFESLLLRQENKFFVTVYNIINNMDNSNDDSKENVSRTLEDISNQYSSYDTGAFEKVYASILNKKAEIFEDVENKLKTLHTDLIKKLENKEKVLFIEASGSSNSVGFDFLVKRDERIIGFVNIKSTNAVNDKVPMTTSFIKFLKQQSKNKSVEERCFFLGNFIVTNSANLLRVNDVGYSEIIVEAEMTFMCDLVNEYSKTVDATNILKIKGNKYIKNNLNGLETVYRFSDEKEIDARKLDIINSYRTPSQQDVIDSFTENIVKELKEKIQNNEETCQNLVNNLGTYVVNFHKFLNTEEKYEKFYELVDYRPENDLEAEKKQSIIDRLIKKQDPNIDSEFTFVAWSVERINSKDRSTPSNAFTKLRKRLSEINLDAAIKNEIANKIQSDFISERIDDTDSAAKRKNYILRLFKDSQKNFVNATEVLINNIQAKIANKIKPTMRLDKHFKTIIKDFNNLSLSDKSIVRNSTQEIYDDARMVIKSKRASSEGWEYVKLNYDYIQNKIGLNKEFSLDASPDSTDSQASSDEEATTDT